MSATSSPRVKVLLIAEAANPEWVSVPLVGWSLAASLAEKVDVHLVTQIRNKAAIQKTGLFSEDRVTYVDSEAVARPLYRLGAILSGGKGKGWTTITAISSLSYYYFEVLVKRIFGQRIKAHEFDVVHRATPLSPTSSSLLAGFCRKANVPFLLGPLNGGVPWPREFLSERIAEREWLSFVRGLYRFLPYYRSTLRDSSAILCGSLHTLGQVPDPYRSKCIYIPENGVNPSVFSGPDETYDRPTMLRVSFVGRLVPYKGAHLLLDAMRTLLLERRASLTIVGDGPERERLERLVVDLGLTGLVTMTGWKTPIEVSQVLRSSDVFCFPSIREFGGGVVLEAMSSGAVPVVVDYAGPGELVDHEVGWSVPVGTSESIVHALSDVLARIADDIDAVQARRLAAIERVRSCYTWEEKALQVLEVYRWVLGRRQTQPVFRFSEKIKHFNANRESF